MIYCNIISYNSYNMREYNDNVLVSCNLTFVLHFPMSCFTALQKDSSVNTLTISAAAQGHHKRKTIWAAAW